MLSHEQQVALEKIMEKVKSNNVSIYRVGGYAGTGKTHLLCEVRKEIYNWYKGVRVAFVTFTGKASSVLKTKLEENNALKKNDYIGTIHGLIYKPITQYDRKLKTGVITGWRILKKEEFFYDLIIIDEGSMVSLDLWADLNSFRCSIIVVGDHGQLPPVSEKVFSLMEKPDFKLEKIHRQAEDNPIVQLSAFVRKKGYIPFNTIWSSGVFKIPWNHKKTQNIWKQVKHDSELVVLCGFNATRYQLNQKIRKEKMGYKNDTPYPGERLVCLKNNHNIKIMNGQLGTLLWIMPDWKDLYRLTIEMDNQSDPYEVMADLVTFGQVTYTIFNNDKKSKDKYKYAISKGYSIDYFDFGYTISVHKAQGSEWNKVILFEQRPKFWDDEYYKRWLYTGITRAKEKLMVISDFWG